MGLWNRVNRALSRVGRSSKVKRRASRLAGSAGLATLEPLEPRQLLFALTVSPADVDPSTGLGTAIAYFGYTIPYLAPAQPSQPGTPTVVNEDFSQQDPGIAFNGRLLAQSNIAIVTNIVPLADLQIIAVPDDTGQPTNDRYLRARVNSPGEYFGFQFYTEANQALERRAARSIAFDVTVDGTNPIGLDVANMTVELRFQGAIIATITGAALDALFQQRGPQPGTGRLVIPAPADNPAFDEIRVVGTPGSPFLFRVDNISVELPQGRYAGIVGSRIFGVAVSLTGPVGASAEFRDLYGRPMVRTIRLGVPTGSQLPLVDLDDDGRPNFNDGIGSITLRGVDNRSTLTMIGGTIESADTPPQNIEPLATEGNFYFTYPTEFDGLFGNFESSGFGYARDQNRSVGLPAGPGSLIIGSPYIRPQNNYTPDDPVQTGSVQTGFTRPDQGIFVLEGASMSSVMIHGIVHGSSQFTGAIDRLNIGYLVGSVTVAGDLGALIIGSDAGRWSSDPGGQIGAINVKTNASVFVGRTVGEISIAGRSSLDITVAGDLNSPTTRPPRDVFNHYELEWNAGINPTPQPTVIRAFRAIMHGPFGNFYVDATGGLRLSPARGVNDPTRLYRYDGFGFPLPAHDQKLAFGPAGYRNDSIMTAEWLGGVSSGVRVKGDLSGRDPVSGEDDVDVYAFAADGTQKIVIEVQSLRGFDNLLVRVMDEQARTLASPEITRGLTARRIEFTPDAPGIYYIAITDPLADDDGFAIVPYTMLVTGMATATVGTFRVGANFGGSEGLSASLNVLSGSVGAVRVGTAIGDAGGTEISPAAILNYNNAPANRNAGDDLLDMREGSIRIAGNLYGLIAGSDINWNQGSPVTPIDVFIGGNLGMMSTGLSPIGRGLSVNHGDVNYARFIVGGRIGSVNIRGGIGMDQDNPDDPRATIGLPGSTLFRTGNAGGPGDIGFFRVGFHVAGDALRIDTSPGSRIGALLISQDAYTETNPRTGLYEGQRGMLLNTGPGSDIRFVDFPRVDNLTGVDNVFGVVANQPLTFVDDGGATFRITVESAIPGLVGAIRVLPVSGTQGVVVGQIRIFNLVDATLRIEGVDQGNAPAVVSLGRIVVDAANENSQIVITGNLQIDVYRIDILADSFNSIVNDTPGGDLLFVDAGGLNTLRVTRGNLGRTEVPAWGPQNFGVLLGLDSERGDGVRGSVGIPAAYMTPYWNGNIYRPLRDMNFRPGNSYADDVGFPLHERINGLVVRGGDVQLVEVSGSVGDVLLTGDASSLISLVVNSDAVTPAGQFHGITGIILASDIVSVDVGDGVARRAPSPMATTGIIAFDDIISVTANRVPNATLGGIFYAANDNSVNRSTTGGPDPDVGITRISVTNGRIEHAFIHTVNFDSFWISLAAAENDFYHPANITQIELNNSSMLDVDMSAQNIVQVSLTGANGIWDASRMRVQRNIVSVTATAFRNTTVQGSDLEVRFNEIAAGGDVGEIRAVAAPGGPANDIADLSVSADGSAVGGIFARDILRSSFNIAGAITTIAATRGIKSSAVIAGSVLSIDAAIDIVSSTVQVAGRVNLIRAGNRIMNSDLAVNGPDGRLDAIVAGTLLSGKVSATGSIDSISVPNGDIRIELTTSTERGSVGTISAGRDADVSGEISANLGSLVAGRHVGSFERPGGLVVQGNVTGQVNAAGGQIYNSLRVGGTITGTVNAGVAASSKPGSFRVSSASIVAAGGINTIRIVGDFGGEIISYSGGIGSVRIENGSFLGGRSIAAYAGSLNSVVIAGGHLLGGVYADVDIVSLRVEPVGGIFGDVGVNPDLSPNNPFDAARNQLPGGVVANPTIQGPRIEARRNIVSFFVGGSIFESTIVAGQRIQNITVAGDVRPDPFTFDYSSFFAAGDGIDNVTVFGSVIATRFISGLVSFGSDNRLGGIGAAADVIKSGDVGVINIGGGAIHVDVIAGMTAGADGTYITGDDRTALGLSFVNSVLVGGAVVNTRIWADSISAAVLGDSRFTTGGTAQPSVNPLLDNGAGTPGVPLSGTQAFTVGANTVTISFAGAGQAFFDAATSRVTLRDTDGGSSLIVAGTLPLASMTVVSNDGASLGLLRMSDQSGTGNIVIDGNIGTIELGVFSGQLAVGGDVGSLTVGTFAAGTIAARVVNTLVVAGNYGNPNKDVTGEVRIDLLLAGNIRINGASRGLINVERSATTLVVTGPVERSQFRFGGSLGAFNAPSVVDTLLSVRDAIGSISVAGDVNTSNFQAGGDLGRNVLPGGVGLDADVTTAGSIGGVVIGGNFRQSSMVAGLTRGPDGYFGTADDTVASGRSSIGNVAIGGTQVGSTRNSESYRIASSGAIGLVTVGGQPITTLGNFAVERFALAPRAIQVTDLRVTADSQIYTAFLTFNQPIDSGSIASALSVSEVRGVGEIETRLIPGFDYTTQYDAASNVLRVVFSRSVTSQDLPQRVGVPGPGIYRFFLDANRLRGKLANAVLDGDGDGIVRGNDHFSSDYMVGDAGDKLSPVTAFTGPNNSYRVDFYGPTNLNIVMDNNHTPDGLPDTNKTLRVFGAIGDHPDNDTNFFRFGGDVDVYSITLIAGQILQLGALQGAAQFAPFVLLAPNGTSVGSTTDSAFALGLPVTPPSLVDLTTPSNYLIRQSGTYLIVVGNAFDINSAQVPNPDTIAGTVGDYNFTVTVFDDGDTGFGAPTDAGDGAPVVNPPAPIDFAGPDLTFGTDDDRAEIVIGSYTFRLNFGPDGIPNTADDVVSGSNSTQIGAEITSTRTGDGTITSVISAAIGPKNAAGVPSDRVTPDIDVFHLNNRQPIAPGTSMRITLLLNETGADLGSRVLDRENENRPFGDFRGEVQFGLFDTSTSTGLGDAVMVFSPSDIRSAGGAANTLLADDGVTRYGFDANGDYFIEFIVPDRIGAGPGIAGTFAVYVQGVFNTDYGVEIVTRPTPGAIARKSQNFFIETAGGSLTWLESSGQTTRLAPFSARQLGFAGTVAGGQNVEQYILSQLTATLNNLFAGQGFDVRFSTNPSDFEFEEFSTIYLSSTADPVSRILSIFDNSLFGFFDFSQFGNAPQQRQSFSTTQPFGFSQRVDAFNADRTDEAVVFVPSFSILGLASGQTEVDSLVQSLAGAVGRRAGELMGLRITGDNGITGPAFDLLAANSVVGPPGPGSGFVVSPFARTLSSPFDSITNTNFYLGLQNGFGLLNKYIS